MPQPVETNSLLLFRDRLSDAGLGELKIFIENSKDAWEWREGLKKIIAEAPEYCFEVWRASITLKAVRNVEKRLAQKKKCSIGPFSEQIKGHEWCSVSYFMVAGKFATYVIQC